MQNMYIKLDKIEGESTSSKGGGMIQVISWAHRVTMPISSAHPSGVAAKTGRTAHDDLTFTKRVDKTSPTLNMYCSAGTNIANASFYIYSDDSDASLIYQVDVEDVIISSVAVASSGDGPSQETVTLYYERIKWSSVAGKKVTGGWDLQKNAKY